MWFMGDDGLMHPVESCDHPIRYMDLSSQTGASGCWCGLCGGVYR